MVKDWKLCFWDQEKDKAITLITIIPHDTEILDQLVKMKK